MGISQSSPIVTHYRELGSTEYDYVICGGGSAGCVLASRLSEDPNVSVLLIEAGNSHHGNLLVRIPMAFSRLFKTAADWNFSTVPQKTLNDRQIYWPRGKILGGSSSINASIWHHCAPSDLDEWETLGATGWGYKDILPYLKKAENFTPNPKYPGVDVANHGSGGPVETGYRGYSEINQTINETVKSMGVPWTDDLNTSKGTLGVTNWLSSIDPTGSRSSSATGYLTQDVLARPNLKVVVNTLVEKIIFATSSSSSSSSPQAVGVEISSISDKYRVTARKEVILSAGAVGTPHILLLSGLGPKEELEATEVEVVKDLPAVGKNLSDHLSCGPMTLRALPGTTWDRLRKPLAGLVALLKWLLRAESAEMGGLGTAGGALLRSDDSDLPLLLKQGLNGEVEDKTSGPDAPDIELVWLPLIALNNGFTQAPLEASGITVSAIALRPSSTGTIRLKSADARDAPLIDANYLATESDMNVIIRGVRFLLNMAKREPLASKLDLKTLSDATGSDFFWPGDADPEKVTDEQLKVWIRKNAAPPWHPVSTARIGLSPSTSVVDSFLRVHGVQGLRVVDASVFPAQVSGHPNAIVIGIAERASDLIKGVLQGEA